MSLADGYQNGNGLQLEKRGPTFPSLTALFSFWKHRLMFCLQLLQCCNRDLIPRFDSTEIWIDWKNEMTRWESEIPSRRKDEWRIFWHRNVELNKVISHLGATVDKVVWKFQMISFLFFRLTTKRGSTIAYKEYENTATTPKTTLKYFINFPNETTLTLWSATNINSSFATSQKREQANGKTRF